MAPHARTVVYIRFVPWVRSVVRLLANTVHRPRAYPCCYVLYLYKSKYQVSLNTRRCLFLMARRTAAESAAECAYGQWVAGYVVEWHITLT